MIYRTSALHYTTALGLGAQQFYQLAIYLYIIDYNTQTFIKEVLSSAIIEVEVVVELAQVKLETYGASANAG
jgi:hypothetical protein